MKVSEDHLSCMGGYERLRLTMNNKVEGACTNNVLNVIRVCV